MLLPHHAMSRRLDVSTSSVAFRFEFGDLVLVDGNSLMLIGVAAVFVDPVVQALCDHIESLRYLGNLVTSVNDLLYCYNIEIFGIAFCGYVQIPLDCVSVTLLSV